MACTTSNSQRKSRTHDPHEIRKNDSGKIGLDGTDVLAVPARTFFGSTHAGQDVLFDESIALVVLRTQPFEQRRKIDAPLTQLAENAVTQGGEVVPPLGPRTARELRLKILEVDVPDAIFEAVECGDEVHILRPRAAVIMAGIKDEAEPLGVGELKQRGNLFRRFNIPAQ